MQKAVIASVRLSLSVVVSVAAVVTATALPVFAQDATRNIAPPRAEAIISEEEEARPAPIPFIPLTYQDLSAAQGRIIQPGSLITRDDGRTVSGAAFLAEANEFERAANAAGDSLTDRPDAISTREEANALYFEALNADPVQVALRSRREVEANPPTSVSERVFMAPSGGGKTLQGGGKTVEKIYKWSYKKGSKSNVSIDIAGKVVFRASKDMAELNGYLNADAYLHNKRFEVITLEYLSDAPAKGEGRTIGSVSVGGFKKWTRDKVGNFADTTLLTKEWQIWAPKDTQVEIRTSVLGIPVVARAGVEGVIGVQLKASLRALGVGFATIPYAQVRAFAEAAFDLIVVEFHIGGELNILKYQVPIWAYGEARISKGRWALKATIDVSNRITAGDGRIYAYAKAFGFKSKKKTLVSWDAAFDWSGQLYKEEFWKFI